MSNAFTPAFRERLAGACAAFPRIAHEGGNLKRAAVALTLTAADDGSGQTAFVLTRRAASLRAHFGQWALPGGGPLNPTLAGDEMRGVDTVVRPSLNTRWHTVMSQMLPDIQMYTHMQSPV